MRKSIKFLVLSGLVLMLAGMAQADNFTFTLVGTQGGQPVKAQVFVQTNNGSLTLDIYNYVSNPTAQSQVITGLQLNLTSTLSGAALQTTGSWTQLNWNTTPFQSTVTNNGWGQVSSLGGSGNRFAICAGASGGTCGWKPNGIIGGPGVTAANYTNANTSITGNGNPSSHGTYLLGNTSKAVVFVITAAGVKSSDSVGKYIQSVTLNWGTSSSLLTSAPIPEPASFLLFGTGLAGVLGVVRRKQRRA